MTKDEAIEWAGGLAIHLAAKLGITHGAISHWETIPLKRQYQLARLSKGKLKVDDVELEAAQEKRS